MFTNYFVALKALIKHWLKYFEYRHPQSRLALCSSPSQVETVFGSPNMTVAYHVTGRDTVYPPSVVLEGLESYGRDKLIADLRQYLPLVTALPLPVAPWRARPASSFQLKTGQRVFSQSGGSRKLSQKTARGFNWCGHAVVMHSGKSNEKNNKKDDASEDWDEI